MASNPGHTRRRPAQGIAATGALAFFLAGLAPAWAQTDGNGGHNGEGHDADHHVPLFPAHGNEHGRQGFVRIINHEDDPGEVHIQAIDDSGHRPGEIMLMMDAGETVHFNSMDLEIGGMAAEDKGLSGTTGAPMQGDWRLAIRSSLHLEVLAYVRHEDGFLTSMTDTAPSHGPRHRVAVFNPGSNPNQVSHLRLTNPGDEEAKVNIVGIDDGAQSPGETVGVTVGAGQSVTLSAGVLEEDAESGDFAGHLGDGAGKWQLDIVASEPIRVMSLMESTMTNQLTNLSTAPMTEFESARDVFDADISQPLVQSICVECHVQGGRSGHTPLVFVTSETDDHTSHNFGEFTDYLTPPAENGNGDPHDHDHGADVILDKIQGNRGHGGGEKVPAATENFRNTERFLWILEDEVASGTHDHGEVGHGDG